MHYQYNIYFGLTTQHGKQLSYKYKAQALSLIASKFPCFTVLESFGYWQGIKEKSIKIEVIQDDKDDDIFQGISNELAILLDQESVLFTRYDLCGQLVKPELKPALKLA